MWGRRPGRSRHRPPRPPGPAGPALSFLWATRVVTGSPVPLSAVTGVYSLLIQDGDHVDEGHNRSQQQAGGAGVPVEKTPSGPEPGLVSRIRDPRRLGPDPLTAR